MRFTLCDGAQTTGGNLLRVQLHCPLGKVEAFLHHSCQLPDATAFLAEHVLRSRGHDDDLSAGWGHTPLHTTVPILGKFTGQELIQFCLEHSISYKLSLFRDLSRHLDR